MNDEPLPPEERQKLRIVGFGMLAGALALLGVVVFMMPRMVTTGLEVLGYVGVGFTLLMPLLAHSMRQRLAQGRLVQMALLESAIIFGATTALVSHSYWPIFATALPLALLLRETTSGE